jgi:hypothetical protein
MCVSGSNVASFAVISVRPLPILFPTGIAGRMPGAWESGDPAGAFAKGSLGLIGKPGGKRSEGGTSRPRSWASASAAAKQLSKNAHDAPQEKHDKLDNDN